MMGLCLNATRAGMCSEWRIAACPLRLMVLRPRTGLPERLRRGVTR